MPQREKESKETNGQDLVGGSIPELKGFSVPVEETPPTHTKDSAWEGGTHGTRQCTSDSLEWSREAIFQGSPAWGWGWQGADTGYTDMIGLRTLQNKPGN